MDRSALLGVGALLANCIIWFSSAPLALAADPECSRKELPYAMVRGTVTQVFPNQVQGAWATVRIDYVYVGCPALVGKTFMDYSTDGGDSMGLSAIGIYSRGERGIWCVDLAAMSPCLGPFGCRAREIDRDLYRMATIYIYKLLGESRGNE